MQIHGSRATDNPSDSSSSTSTSDEEGLDAVTPSNPYQREHGGGVSPYGGQGFQWPLDHQQSINLVDPQDHPKEEAPWNPWT